MFPEYFLTLRDNILDDDDIKRIQEIYGKKEVEQKTKTKSFSTKFSTTTPRPTSPGLTPCEGTLRAVFEGLMMISFNISVNKFNNSKVQAQLSMLHWNIMRIYILLMLRRILGLKMETLMKNLKILN